MRLTAKIIEVGATDGDPNYSFVELKITSGDGDNLRIYTSEAIAKGYACRLFDMVTIDIGEPDTAWTDKGMEEPK